MKHIVISLLCILIWFAASSLSQKTQSQSTTTSTSASPPSVTSTAPLALTTVTPVADNCTATADCCATTGCGLYVNCAALNVSITVCAKTGNYSGCDNSCTQSTTTASAPPSRTTTQAAVTTPTAPTTDNVTENTTTNNPVVTTATSPTPVQTTQSVDCTAYGVNRTMCCSAGCVYLNCTILVDDKNVTVAECQAKTNQTTSCNNLCVDNSTIAPDTTSAIAPTESTTIPVTGTSETTTASKGDQTCPRTFDGISFVGGMILVTILFIAGIVGYKIYSRRKENRYRQF